MVRRMRAAKTKTHLREITKELSSSADGTSSLEVVKAFRTRFPLIDEDERSDLIELGLMVLAGRVAASNGSTAEQSDLFLDGGYPEFVDVRIKKGNKFVVTRKLAGPITVREYFANPPEQREKAEQGSRPSRRQLYHQKMVELRDMGLLDITVPEYLSQSRAG